ncbi:MAG TPA: outer membrane protein assembly factor BamC [Pseudomonadales bacterium]
MLERFFRALVVSVIVLTAGCGWFRDNSVDYRSARELPPLVIPKGLDGQRIHSFYVIPPAREVMLPEQEFEVPRPEPLIGDANDQAVRIQKLGDEQWALVNFAPDETWPLLTVFLESNRIPLLIENGTQGLLVTDWLQPEGALPREQYLIRVDSGVQVGTSEIHVRQRDVGGDVSAAWPQRSNSYEREYKFLYQLSTYLASHAGDPSVSLLAQGIRAASKVTLQQENGRPYLLLELPYARGWASIGNALAPSGFEALDQDYSAGTYMIRPAHVEEPGWWARLWGAEMPDIVDMQLTVTRVGDARVAIRIDTAEGLSVAEQLRYLALIKGNLR